MTDDARQALQNVLDFCNAKWTEADQAPSGPWPTPDTLSGRKQAYNNVLQYVRTLIAEAR